jgi:hypothetical protein
MLLQRSDVDLDLVLEVELGNDAAILEARLKRNKKGESDLGGDPNIAERASQKA